MCNIPTNESYIRGEIAKILFLNEHEKRYIYEIAKRKFPHLETAKIKIKKKDIKKKEIKKRKLPHMPKSP